MTISAYELFEAVGAVEPMTVPWGIVPELRLPGIYVITTQADPLSTRCVPFRFSPKRIEQLLGLRDVFIDGEPASAEALEARLLACAPPEQNVVYVGRASRSVARRVKQFYDTAIGARAPHAGGWPIQLLDTDLWVHHAAVEGYEVAEVQAIDAFVEDAKQSPPQLSADRPIPFANLDWPKHGRKRHGIRGATG